MRTFLIVLLSTITGAVTAQKSYFQQDVNYTIDVTLNDKSHILKGYEKLVYTNHSSDTLKFLFFHLWPNAYKNDKTAFTEQMVENKEKLFYFSKEEDKGFIDSLDFKVNGDPVNVSDYNNNQDIIMLELNSPLMPGKSITITTPFRVVIPAVFSRLGHDGQTYQISQWYPKPAVYDNRGWHPMPYLDQGEFYSEIGSYEVNITLPANYVVASTGDLQQDSEKKFIETRLYAKDTSLKEKFKKSIESETATKTITYKQSNVHDFAWFASKNFLVEKKLANLPSGKKVECYSYFKPWNSRNYVGSTDAIVHTIEYLSAHVGEYPYSHASVVDGKLLAGGGMEYPNVTVIGSISSKSDLQTVIIHEVGHNWFYGLLASNEREHPWMDEGINSFYENQLDNILIKKQDSDSKENQVGKGLTDKLNGSFIYFLNSKQNQDQPIDIASQDYTKINYGGIVYKKAQMMMEYLQAYLGNDVFEKGMKRYYNEWHFKHPYPEDFRKIMEEESRKELKWFFEDGLQTTKKIDFKLTHVDQRNEKSNLVYATSRNDFTGPIPIMAVKGDSVYATQWIEYPYNLPATFAKDLGATEYKIDDNEIVPDSKLINNVEGSFLTKMRWLPRVGYGLGLSKKSEYFLLPSLGYNFYDKFMLGAVIHNLRMPNNQFQFAISPMYSFGAKQLVGSGIIGYSLFLKNKIQKITIALQGRSYHHQSSTLNISKPLFLRHIRIAPSLTIDFKNPIARSPVSNQLSLRYYAILNQQFNYTLNTTDSLFRPSVQDYKLSNLVRLSFIHKNARTFHPYSYMIVADANQEFLKLGLTANLRIDYHLKNKSFYARTFAGKFFDFNNSINYFGLRQQYLASTSTSYNDFMYDDIYVARNEQSGTMAQQVSIREGGFKIRTNQYANPLGMSDNWLFAVNFRSDLPIKSPVKLQVFIDAGTFANAGKLNPSGNKLLFDGGLELHLLGDMIIIYAPLVMSKDFKDYTKSVYAKNRLLNTMSFSLNLSSLNLLQTQNVTKILGY
jgi:hypothetical protein